MFHQVEAPVGGSLLLSFAVAALPLATVLLLLGVARRPAWQASLAGIAVALALAAGPWRMPVGLALDSLAAGAAFALWPVMWIVFNALILYNVTVASGRFAAFRDWMMHNLPDDRRVVLVVIGFAFGCLLEGISGFGTPVAITSALLISLGFRPLDALTYTLIFNTAPVAFGALGAPITTLGAVTQLSDVTLGATVGRQVPFIAVLLPFYVVFLYAGWRGVRGVWPVLLVSGGSFGLAQFVSSNWLGYALTDVLSSMTSLLATLGFLKLWRAPADPEFALERPAGEVRGARPAALTGWLPWLVLSAVVIVWIHFGWSAIGQQRVAWPGLHRAVFITTYGRPYDAIWTFQPLATGTAIGAATLLVALLIRLPARALAGAVRDAARQVWLPAVTTMLIVALAYLVNYSGMAFTLGLGVSAAGPLFPLLSAFLGWLAVFLSGSDTSGNALFGNLQVVAAQKLGLDPVLMAASNSSGGVMGKMISPQNICTGTSITGMAGQEGRVLARTFGHSIALTLLLGLLVHAQQYWFPGMVPH
jgi:lactate permease